MKYSISELDNNVSITNAPNERRSKRGSLIRHNNKNSLSLTNQVIPEISHESQDDDNKIVLNNGHHADCNINRHLRFEHENSVAALPKFTPSIQPKFPPNRVISVIEEASV